MSRTRGSHYAGAAGPSPSFTSSGNHFDRSLERRIGKENICRDAGHNQGAGERLGSRNQVRGMFLHREPGLHPEKCIGSGQVAQAGEKQGRIGLTCLRVKDGPGLFSWSASRPGQGPASLASCRLSPSTSQFFSRAQFALQHFVPAVIGNSARNSMRGGYCSRRCGSLAHLPITFTILPRRARLYRFSDP